MSTQAPSLRGRLGSRDGRVVGLLSLAWLLPVGVIGVAGEFALNDDWAYVIVVRRFLEEGVYQRTTWTFTPVLSNLAIGAGFASVFGDSMATLRASSLVLGWVSMLGAYAWGRMQGAAVGACALVAVILGFNPVHLTLSFTFMTDVAFTAMMVWALALFARGLSKRQWWPYVAGAVCATFAVLSRQPGIFVFAALVATLGLRLTARPKLLGGLAVAGLVAVAIYVAYARRVLGPDSRGLLHLATMSLRDPSLPHFLLRHGLDTVCWLGLASFPLAVGLAPPRGGEAVRAVLGAVAFVALGVAGMTVLDLTPPTSLNVLDAGGVGPIELHGATAYRARLPVGLWWALWLGGAATFGFLSARIAERIWRAGVRGLREHPAWALTFLAAGVYLLPLIVRSTLFDRYLLPVLPCLALALVLGPGAVRVTRPRLAFAMAAVLGVTSVVAAADYMRHHRARQALIDELLADHVPPTDIEGGFEFDGLYRFESFSAGSRSEGAELDIAANYVLLERAKAAREGPVDSWPYADRYLVSFSPHVRGYAVRAQATYTRWLPWRTETLYVHERLPPRPA